MFIFAKTGLNYFIYEKAITNVFCCIDERYDITRPDNR